MHTPGPWRIHDMESDAIVAQGPNGGAEVANVANSCWRQNMRADARLISCAPDLLSAAQKALAVLQAGRPGWGIAKDLLGEAIAKATDE